jgi:hypothetical protein
MTMPSPEFTELLNYIEQLIVATRSGSMVWARANPTTLTWDTQTPTPAKLVLQRLDRRQVTLQVGKPVEITKRIYVFQAFDMKTVQQKLSLSGAEDENVNQKLEALFESITSTLSQKDLEFLKSILPPGTRS